MPVIGPSLSRAHLRTREDGGWWSRQHLIKFQIFLCRDGGPCFWMSLGLTISSIPLTLRCFRCRLFRLQSWCPSTSSPTLALSCGRHLSALRRVWRILDSGGLINTGMFVEIRIFLCTHGTWGILWGRSGCNCRKPSGRAGDVGGRS